MEYGKLVCEPNLSMSTGLNVLGPPVKTSIAGHTNQARRHERNRKQTLLFHTCSKDNVIKSLNLGDMSPIFLSPSGRTFS